MKKYQDTASLAVRRIALLIYDIAAVYVAAVFSLWVRFDCSFSGQFQEYYHNFLHYHVLIVIACIAIFTFFHMYSSLWKFASVTEMVNIAEACFCAAVAQIVIVSFVPPADRAMPRSYYILVCIVLFMLELVSRFSYRGLRTIRNRTKENHAKTNVMIIGAGEAGVSLIREITRSVHIDKRVVCVIDDSRKKIGNLVCGVKVVGDRNSIPAMVEKYAVDEIILAMPTVSAAETKKIIEICKPTGCKLLRLPGIYQLVNGEVNISKLRNVDVNDLLGRDPIKVDLDSIMGYVSGRVVMVTGGGGSIGSELCRQIAGHKPALLLIIDIYENSVYEIQQELKRDYPGLPMVVLIASVRNTRRLDKIFEKYRPEIIYHAAAHKHVPLMEDSPNEAIKNNVLGTLKIVQAADKWKVRRFVMISTDKAVNPTNIMGASKRLCEMIIQSYNKHSDTEYVAVRFGNVLGSNGSVIPLFKKQIEAGGPVTVTHPDIIRYFMTIPEAVSLVLQAGAYAKGGEIFVLDMGDPVKIVDLARNLILLSGHKPDEDIKIVYTGLRPGEKLYEEMLMKEEGMQETENKLIHIGKPIEMDEEKFLQEVRELGTYAEQEPEDIRGAVMRLVPTYHVGGVKPESAGLDIQGVEQQTTEEAQEALGSADYGNETI